MRRRPTGSGDVLIEGIIGVQKEAVLAAKRAVVTVEEIVDDFDGLHPNLCVLPHWTVDVDRQSCRAARIRPTRTAITTATTPPISNGTRSPPTATSSRDWMQENVLDAAPDVFAAPREGTVSMTELSDFTPNEMMTIAAARALSNDDVCFVGIGAPSAACNVARLTHAPDITLIYESGTIGTAPDVLPLSIGDGELCETARDHRRRCRRCSATGCRAGASRSASSAPPSSTASATSTPR